MPKSKKKSKAKSKKAVSKPKKVSRSTPKSAPTGSKSAIVAELLGRPSGASVTELVAKTGWQPHTCRAKISILRKGGQKIEKSKNKNGELVYRKVSGRTDQTAPTSKR